MCVDNEEQVICVKTLVIALFFVLVYGKLTAALVVVGGIAGCLTISRKAMLSTCSLRKRSHQQVFLYSFTA